MSPEDYNRKLLPLVITIIICGVIIVSIHIWTHQQVEVMERLGGAGPGIKIEPKEEEITPTKQITKTEKAETLPVEIDRFQELVNKQYEVYSKESEAQKTTPTSKYNIYPSKEELQRIKKEKVLMY